MNYMTCTCVITQGTVAVKLNDRNIPPVLDQQIEYDPPVNSPENLSHVLHECSKGNDNGKIKT